MRLRRGWPDKKRPRLSRKQGLELVQGNLHMVVASGGVGGDEGPGSAPEGVVWRERLRVGDVQPGSQQMALGQNFR